MNEDIVKRIGELAEDGRDGAADETEKTSWLVFSICGKKYAVRSCEVREIIRAPAVYKLPFLPPYIEGVINRRGDPFTVINPLALIDSGSEAVPPEPLFLILKRDDDQLSLHISDILFFHEIENTELHAIANAEDNGIFLGTFEYKGEEIPAVNTDTFELILQKDLGA